MAGGMMGGGMMGGGMMGMGAWVTRQGADAEAKKRLEDAHPHRLPAPVRLGARRSPRISRRPRKS